MEIEKIEIPNEPTAEPKRDNAKDLAELLKLSITEEKKFVPLDNFKWTTDLYTNSAFYIMLKLQNEPESINYQWHFIPYKIPEEKQAEHGRKKEWMQFFCIDDKKVLKKFTKTIRRYFPGVSVNWQPFDAKEYKEMLEKIKQDQSNI